MNILKRLLVSFCAMSALGLYAEGGATMTVLTEKPVIDGKIDAKNEYKYATSITNFLRRDRNVYALFRTRVWMGYDKENMYFAFEMEDSRLLHANNNSANFKANLKGPSQKVWQDECMEIRLLPPWAKKAKGFSHFYLAFNPNGATLSAAPNGFDSKFELKCKVAASRGDGYWYAEAAIPFAALGMPQNFKLEGSVWNFNFTRFDSENGCSTWCNLPDGHHNKASNFGRLYFGDLNSPALKIPDFSQTGIQDFTVFTEHRGERLLCTSWNESYSATERPDMYSRGVWPTYFKKAKGVRVIDLDDNEYIDCSIGGIGATVLGYADDEINEKVKAVIDNGSASTLNPPEEVALAEKLIEMHPWAEMARFCRSGGEAMSVAVRIARTYTGKGTVLFCGYHGWTDWYLAANLAREGALDQMWIAGLSPNGLPKGLAGTALPFMFNDIESFKNAVKEAGDDLAAIVLEPQRNYIVNQDFMDVIHKTAKENNVPLIVDEITAAFRICNGGAHLKLGWQPDIAVFAKSLGNGYPISAIIGKGKVMSAAQDAFITSTNWTERIGPVAALAMIEKFIRCDASKHMVEIATRVQDGWKELAAKYGLKMHIGGIVPLLHFSFEKDNSVNKAYFIQEMLKRGFLASNAFYAMYAHSHEDIDKYLAACDEVFGMLAKPIAEGKVAENLIGKPAGTGFARIN